MAKTYEGKAPLTMARLSSGGYAYIFAGEPVPEGVDSEDLKRLANEEFLVEASATVPAEEPSNEAPSKSAPKPEWEAYARSKGATDADLDGKTKDELIAAYGG